MQSRTPAARGTYRHNPYSPLLLVRPVHPAATGTARAFTEQDFCLLIRDELRSMRSMSPASEEELRYRVEARPPIFPTEHFGGSVCSRRLQNAVQLRCPQAYETYVARGPYQGNWSRYAEARAGVRCHTYTEADYAQYPTLEAAVNRGDKRCHLGPYGGAGAAGGPTEAGDGLLAVTLWDARLGSRLRHLYPTWASLVALVVAVLVASKAGGFAGLAMPHLAALWRQQAPKVCDVAGDVAAALSRRDPFLRHVSRTRLKRALVLAVRLMGTRDAGGGAAEVVDEAWLVDERTRLVGDERGRLLSWLQ